MKLISWNVNGLRALHRKELFYPFLEKYQPDIFCMQETKSHQEQLSSDILNIPGYNSYFESGIRKGYSGVAIYSKSRPKSIQTGFQIDGTVVTAKWQGGTTPSSGNASSIDAYVFVIIKTGASSYTALASQTKFA